MREVNQAGTDLTKDEEGFSLTVYRDVGGVPTVGWGHKVTAEDGLSLGDVITQEQADQFFEKDQAYAASIVERLVTESLTDNQFAALVDFVFNLGSGRFANSTLLTDLNDDDYSAAIGEFKRWIYAGGKPSTGLTTRRERETDLFLTPDGDNQ